MTYQLVKQPSEASVYTLPLGNLGTAVITAIDSVTIAARGLVTEVTPLAYASATFSGSNVQMTLSGGTDGEVYLITVKVATDLAGTIEEEAELHVLDLSYAVPDDPGGVYLTPAGYVDRFGAEELILLTDQDQVGRADKGQLFAALRAATAEVDGYLAKRYLTPISPVPELIIDITAAITRYKLHGDAVPEVVERRYKDARAALTDLARGAMLLPSTTPKLSTTSGSPKVSAATKIFGDDSLEGF